VDEIIFGILCAKAPQLIKEKRFIILVWSAQECLKGGVLHFIDDGFMDFAVYLFLPGCIAAALDSVFFNFAVIKFAVLKADNEALSIFHFTWGIAIQNKEPGLRCLV